MDVQRMLNELREEQKSLEAAITVLSRLAAGQTKRRGRPPKWLEQIGNQQLSEPTATRRRRTISPESRARMAEAQRKRWAAARGEISN
jgi:hypothetical protein